MNHYNIINKSYSLYTWHFSKIIFPYVKQSFTFQSLFMRLPRVYQYIKSLS